MIAIIGAMEQEVEELSSLFTDKQTLVLGGMHFLQGKLEGHEAVLLRCGIGKVNAAVGCALLLERYSPRWVINTGSAGGLLPSQTFGDVVISLAVLHHDADVTAFGYALGQIPGQPQVFSADQDLIEKAQAALLSLRKNNAPGSTWNHSLGLIGSGDVFLHEPERIDALKKNFPSLCAVEMESAAIAQTCGLFGVPFVVLRALSDIAGKESPLKFDEFLPVASHNSATLVREMLKLMPR